MPGGASGWLTDERRIVEKFAAAHRARFGLATPDRGLIAAVAAVESVAIGEAVREALLDERLEDGPTPTVRVEIFVGDAEYEDPVFHCFD